MVPITRPITHSVMASGTSTSRPVANTDFNVVFLVVIYTAGRPPRLGFNGLAGLPPSAHSWLRAVIFLRAIGQIEQIVQLNALAARVGQDCVAGFALRSNDERQFDAGDAGLLDDAAADDVLPDFELSAAGVLAEVESVFDD
jgi:hypothetical protein